ncbi:MAG: DEAD/DEAH box helicase [Bacillota bacterium]
MEKSFGDLGVNEYLIKALNQEGIDKPTGIQQEAIPQALLNVNLVAESETGSGKTLAYVLPLFHKIQWMKKDTQAIVLVPTHELAVQVKTVARNLAIDSGIPINSAVIIGNVNIKRQMEVIKKEKPHIIIGSPGRILELIRMKVIKAHTVETIVIDEADRLLDKNNAEQVKTIIKSTYKDTQLMLFSATINNKTLETTKELFEDFKLIRIKEKTVLSQNIQHMYLVCEKREKVTFLRKLVHILKPRKAMAFINIAYDIELAIERLKYHGLTVEAIYGNAKKEERRTALHNLRTGKSNLLIASDIAARGIDIKNIDYIFSIDIPEEAGQYLHRAGRTGRAGEKGTSICLVTEKEVEILKEHEKKLGIKFIEYNMFKGKLSPNKK